MALLLLLTLPAIAQTPKDDLVKLNKVYMNAKSYSMQVEMKMYAKELDSEATMSYTGETMRDNAYFKTEMMGRVTLVNPDCALLVDKRQHLMLYRAFKKDAPKKEMPDPLAQLNLDSLIGAQSHTLSYKANTTQEKRIVVMDKEGSYKRIEIAFDPETYALKQLVFVYTDADVKRGQAARVVITYRKVSLNKTIDKSNFSETAYINSKGSILAPTEGYKNYRIIDEGKQYTD